jgi:hypothetical protein
LAHHFPPPVTIKADLDAFETLMAMSDEQFGIRMRTRPTATDSLVSPAPPEPLG